MISVLSHGSIFLKTLTEKSEEENFFKSMVIFYTMQCLLEIPPTNGKTFHLNYTFERVFQFDLFGMMIYLWISEIQRE